MPRYAEYVKAGLDPNIVSQLDPKGDYGQEYWKKRITSPQAVQEESEKYWGKYPQEFRSSPVGQQMKQQSEQWVGEKYGVSQPQPQQQEDPYVLVNNIPDQEFNLGRMAIENDFIHETNMAKQTTVDIVQVEELINDAKMVKQLKMDELMMNHKKTKMIFEKYNRDNTLSNQDRLFAKTEYHKANPIYRLPKQTQTEPFGQAKIQKVMSELQTGGQISEGVIREFVDEDVMSTYAQQNLPQELWPAAQKIISDRFGDGGQQQMDTSAPPDQALSGYWKEISNEEKQEIMVALQKNPKNLKIILQRLKTGGK